MRHRVIAFAGVVLGAALSALGAPAVTVTLDRSAAGPAIPADFNGLSFETSRILPDPDGSRLFSPENTALIGLFKALNVRSLRIGGNTADRATVPIPSTADIDSVFAFAKAADVKIIYTLRLNNAQPSDIAATAKYVTEKYGDLLSCLAIGNEPNVYAKEYPVYREMMTNFIKAVNEVAPGAVFCGPSTTPGKSAWARSYADDFGPGGKVKVIAQHSYPGNSANKVADPAEGRRQMLSPEWVAGYQKFYDSFAPAAIKNGLGFRLEEANSFFHGGAKGASDSFASALWALDYMHWWASHGAAGVNFHTGDRVVAAGDAMKPCWYATFVSTPAGYELRPIAYAQKAFFLGGRGRVVPVKMTHKAGVNLRAYATEADGQTVLTVINKEHSEGAEPVSVTIAGGRVVRTMALKGSTLATTSEVMLGGAAISGDGKWGGRWEELGQPSRTVQVPAGSALLIEMNGERQP